MMRPILQFAALVAIATLALQPRATAVAANKNALEELDRIDVYAARPDLTKLRQALVEAEDRFYAKYNELNRNDDFDVNCRVEARTGTRLATRTCRPVFHESAVQEPSRQAIEHRQKFDSHGGYNQLGANSPPVPAGVAIMAGRPAFEQNMREVVESHPELLTLLEERAAAARALENATRRKSEDKKSARGVP